MSLHKFELKEDHVKLAKQMNWVGILQGSTANTNVDNDMDEVSMFGGDNVHEDMGVILYGAADGDLDPFSETLLTYSEEQITEMDNLLEELPTAIDIIMFNGNFELGHFKTKTYERNWKRYEPK
jgi:hypothetical protein